MNFAESRLLGIQVDEVGREVSLSIVDVLGAKYILDLHGVERLLIDEFRQQNIIEEIRHWTQENSSAVFREAVFFLITGVSETECGPQLATVACAALDRVGRGELQMMEITAVFGAKILALFSSLTIRPVA